MNSRNTKMLLSVGAAVLVLVCLLLVLGGTGTSLAKPVPQDDAQVADSGPKVDAAVAWNTAENPIYLPLISNAYPTCEAPVLAWATSQDAVLLRWRWPCKCKGQATFNVYRNGELLAQDITRVTNPVTATNVLSTDWGWLTSHYTDVTTIPELYAKLDGNSLLADQLANTHYRVALILGLGYLDEEATPGATYQYEVEAVVGGQVKSVGSVGIRAGRITPLDPPVNLTATAVISSDLQGSPDWLGAQENRKADKKIYLRWDVPTSTAESWPANWTASYDIFRATAPDGDYERINIQDGEDRPVIPEPASTPPITTASQYTAYTLHDYYYVDDDPDLEYGVPYYYRIAPRDLLGQPREWPLHASQFSDWIEAVPKDTMPPAVPENLSAVPLTTSIVLTWTEQHTDTVGYHLYKSTNITASVLTEPCVDMEACWFPIASPAEAIYTDHNVITDTVYWYRVRAEDAFGNLSAWSDPVPGVVHDNTPPCAPTVIEEGGLILVYPCEEDPTDTVLFYLYCSFDGSPEIMIQQLLTNTLPGPLELRGYLHGYYTPGMPIDVVCRVQSADLHGNLSEPKQVSAVRLCPPAPVTPTAPIITDITTREEGEKDWAAEISWAAEDAPGLDGFRIYSQVVGSNAVFTVATVGPEARSFLDSDVKLNFIYSYTVAAVRADDSACYSGTVVSSQPFYYKVIPCLGRCTRPVLEMFWDDNPSSEYVPGTGTRLYWKHPDLNDTYMRVVVYRGMQENGDYVAITPPFDTLTYGYVDTDAEHENYWYVVAMLDQASGEIIYETVPWSAGGGGVPDASWSDSRWVALYGRGSTGAPVAQSASAPAAVQDVASIDPYADTYIHQGDPNTNFGSEPVMVVAWSSDVVATRHALLAFDLSSIPPGATIDTADILVHLDHSGPEDAAIRLLKVTSPWDEGSVTWNSAPSVSGPYSYANVETTAGWYTWSVTSLVQEWVYTPTTNPNYGISLQGPTLEHLKEFSTREGGVPAMLVVNYFPPPDTLVFGVLGDNPFEVTGVVYDVGSTPDCLSGSGIIALGGSPLATFYRTVTFSCIQVLPGSNIVTSGTGIVALPAPLHVDPPDGSEYFEYTVFSLSLNEQSGWGEVELVLPDNIVGHEPSVSLHGPAINLDPATLHQDLGFDMTRDFGGQSCAMAPPDFYFEMNPLPLNIVPLGTVTFTHYMIDVGDTCTQYEERYSGTRPGYPNPDANDGYLRPAYASTRHTNIFNTGLSGGFHTDELISYTTVMPYGFAVHATGGIDFEIVDGRISDGVMHGPIDIGLDYYDTPVSKTLTYTGVVVPLPGRRFDGFVPVGSSLLIGSDGALFGEVLAALDAPDTPRPVWWAGGGFVLREPAYLLFVPPIQTRSGYLPSEEAAADWEVFDQVQAGLNLIIPPGESADFTWYHCTADREIKFPDGVQTDVYLRRGGVSDFVTATIPLTNPVHTPIHGYTATVTAFSISFCDNSILDRDIAGDYTLPWPADVVIPTFDWNLDPHTACVSNAKVREDADPLVLAY